MGLEQYPLLKEKFPLYHYEAQVTKVTDGDTIHATVDCGFRILVEHVFRFYGIDTAEIYHPRSNGEYRHGMEAKKFVEERIGGKEIFIETVKHRASIYNRWEAIIYYKNEKGEFVNLIDELKANGFEKRASYEN